MSSFFIRSSTVRLGILISSVVIATILVFQLVWLKKLYRLEQKDFDHGVVKSVRGLYEDLNMSNYYSSHLDELIERPEPHLFLARIELPVRMDSLVGSLHYELEDFDIFTNCQWAIYNSDSGKYVNRGVLFSPGGKDKQQKTIPQPARNFNYLALYFPNRGGYVLSQMNTWIFSSAFLLLVLILFGVGMYFFYRQKFLNETQKDFIHSFTHEFKTPVSVITLAADVLKKEDIVTKPEKLATYAGIVDNQAIHLNNQIQKLLQFANTESGHLHLKKEQTDFHQLIHIAARNLAPLIDEKKAKLDFELRASDPNVMGDKDYLLIVITNLVENALKYARNPVITLRTFQHNNRFIFSVQDNGIGVEAKEIGKLFRKFYRVRNGETYMTKGFGLGLSFVRMILDAHGGKISASSEPGKGSVFTVELSQS